MLKVAKFIIGWPISIIALFFVARVIFPHLETIINNLENINRPLLLLSIVSFILYFFVRTFVWKLILKEQGYDLPLKTASFLWEMSELKRFVPGVIWSFLGKTSLFREIGLPPKIVLKCILIEIEFFVLSCFLVSTLSFSFLFQRIITFVPYKPFLPPIATIAVLLVIFLFIFSTPIANRINIKYLNNIKSLLPLFSPKTNSLILFTAVIYTFFFGLGTYFVAISVAYISLSVILSLIGFFVLSLIFGYLSVIAPMGIGIREGIITLGLSKLLPLTIAGFISIFARLLLIFSELCFILSISLWHKAKNKYIIYFENFVSLHKHELALAFFVTVYFAYFTIASFLRFDNFYTGRFDLGNMDQAVWNTINGRIFATTDPNGTGVVSRLAFHADFILILLSPLYLLWEHPKMLLLIQTLVLAAGAVFVYGLAKEILKDKNLSLTLGLLFLFNPALQFTNLYDFHGVTLATTFLLAAFYFIRKNKYILTFIFLILAGLTKEQVWVITGLLGLYILFSKSRMTARKIFGFIITLISIFIFYFLIWHAMPNALGSQHFALSYYSDFGDSPTSVIKNVFFSPQATINVLVQKEQLDYLRQLFQPVGFMSVLALPFMIFAIPDLLINLLSKNPNLHQIYYQYSATITPFIFISTIFAIKNIKKWFPKIPNAVFICFLLFFTLKSAYDFGPLPGAKKPNIAMFTRQFKDAKLIDNFLSTIPPKFSVAATNNVGSHLSQRQKIYTIPVGLDKADYIVFLLNDLSETAERLRFNKNYIEVFSVGNFVAFKKRNL